MEKKGDVGYPPGTGIFDYISHKYCPETSVDLLAFVLLKNIISFTSMSKELEFDCVER